MTDPAGEPHSPSPGGNGVGTMLLNYVTADAVALFPVLPAPAAPVQPEVAGPIQGLEQAVAHYAKSIERRSGLEKASSI